jgi:hypothetical protein
MPGTGKSGNLTRPCVSAYGEKRKITTREEEFVKTEN